jgi:hypothetical protein
MPDHTAQPALTWKRSLTPGGMTLYTATDLEGTEWRIESWGGRSRNGDRTGYRCGSVTLYRDGAHVRGASTVRDAKAAAERRAVTRRFVLPHFVTLHKQH